MLDKLHFTQFGQSNLIPLNAIRLNPLVGKRAIAALSLEPGFTTAFSVLSALNKSSKCEVNPLYYVLQDIGVKRFYPALDATSETGAELV